MARSFLDEDLVKIAFSIPYGQKSNPFSGKKHTKYLHRKAYPSYTTNFPKHGFSIPLYDYLSLESRKKISEKISKKITMLVNTLAQIILNTYQNNSSNILISAKLVTNRFTKEF